MEELHHLRRDGAPVRKRRRRWLLVVLLVIGVALCLWQTPLGIVLGLTEPPPGQYDATLKSSNLPRDVKRMWETRALRGTRDPTHGPNPRASTDRAINAASRVFNTVELVGKTQEEVMELLGDSRSSSDSIYNFPFWPAAKTALVYRFDSGAYGWQFNVILDETGRVRTVERHWIH